MPTALLTKLKARNVAEASIADLVMRLFARERPFTPGADLDQLFQEPTSCSLLVDGIAAQYRLLSSGRRQITSVLVPGDFINLPSIILGRQGYNVVALAPCRVAIADIEQFNPAIAASATFSRLLWIETLVEAGIQRESLVSMGRRSAIGHLAHFICEMYERLAAIGRINENSFHLPLTQMDLADALGLSVVHVNRLLRTMRNDGVAVWTNHVVAILNENRLRELAEFDPAYLAFDRIQGPPLSERVRRD